MKIFDIKLSFIGRWEEPIGYGDPRDPETPFRRRHDTFYATVNVFANSEERARELAEREDYTSHTDAFDETDHVEIISCEPIADEPDDDGEEEVIIEKIW